MTINLSPPKNTVRRGLSLTFIQNAVGVVFSFGSVILISRLLTPAEIGVFSIAVGFVALVHMLRDFGVSEFIVQEKDLDEALVRTVFTINLIVAWVLGILVFLSSGLVGRFYDNAGVSQVLRVMSVVFILMPFGTTVMAQMTRNMEFGKLFRIRVTESVIRSCAAVGLAYAGFSYMSMAWASLIAIAVNVASCALWGWKYRVRGLAFSQWRRVVNFGSYQTVADLARTFGAEAPSLAIGKLIGMAAVGFYSRGYGIVNLYVTRIVGTVGAVAFPAYAERHRKDGSAPQLYLKSLVYLTGISWPFFGAGILLAYPVIFVLFGKQWGAAVPLMRWLCAAALVAALTSECNRFLVALGRVKRAAVLQVQYQAATILLTIAAAFVSLEAVAAVQILASAITVALYQRTLGKYVPLQASRMARALAPSAVLGLATCVVPAIVVSWPGFVTTHTLLALIVSVVGGCASWLLTVIVMRHPLLEELRLLASRLPKRLQILPGM